ncbi:hypothetical protein BC628DRAFT_1348890 [Trametes gibbosa]|nr:hypothetical protein BC628DRAFT_1348890 [Trametes gibbosa]
MYHSWSSNPEANYIMIEPGIKYMIRNKEALRYAPKPWYERPLRPPADPVPIDMIRFLPTRKLQTSWWGSTWNPTPADDLDSFSYLFLHALLFRGKQRGESTMGQIQYDYGLLGASHAKNLMDNRDHVETHLWLVSESVDKASKTGKQPCGTTIDAFARPLYKMFKVNESHHAQERQLAQERRSKENVEERARAQYEEYLAAMEAVNTAIQEGWAREEKLQDEKKAEKKKKTKKALKRTLEQTAECGSTDLTEEEVVGASEEGVEESVPESVGSQDVSIDAEGEVGGIVSSSRDSSHEPLSKRPRLE